MNDRQRRRYEREQRVDVYMDAAAEDLPANSKGGTLAASLKALLTRAAAQDVERAANTSKRRQGTGGREKARTALRKMVKSVWDTHKSIALDRPDIKGLFESPSKIKNDRALVTTARNYADTADSLASVFAEYGLTAAFFNNMRVQADRLEAHAALQVAGVGAGVDTNAALDETLREADEVVARLDTVVRNRYRDDPAKLAAWESASRVERAPRRKAEDDTAPPPPPPTNA